MKYHCLERSWPSSDTGNGTKWTLNLPPSLLFERASPDIIERLSSGHPARDVYTSDATDFDNRSNRIINRCLASVSREINGQGWWMQVVSLEINESDRSFE